MNTFVCRLGTAIACATFAVATLGNAVGCVVGVGSKEQMTGANARRVVASVQDVHPFRNLSEMDFVRKPIGSYIRFGFASFDHPVSVLGFCSRPEPACVRLDDLVPKAFVQRLDVGLSQTAVAAQDTTAQPAALANFCLIRLECFSADDASAGDLRLLNSLASHFAELGAAEFYKRTIGRKFFSAAFAGAADFC